MHEGLYGGLIWVLTSTIDLDGVLFFLFSLREGRKPQSHCGGWRYGTCNTVLRSTTLSLRRQTVTMKQSVH